MAVSPGLVDDMDGSGYEGMGQWIWSVIWFVYAWSSDQTRREDEMRMCGGMTFGSGESGRVTGKVVLILSVDAMTRAVDRGYLPREGRR